MGTHEERFRIALKGVSIQSRKLWRSRTMLGGVDEFEQVADCRDLYHAEEALGELVVARGDGTVDLEMTEHALDAVAFLIEHAVVDDRLPAV